MILDNPPDGIVYIWEAFVSRSLDTEDLVDAPVGDAWGRKELAIVNIWYFTFKWGPQVPREVGTIVYYSSSSSKFTLIWGLLSAGLLIDRSYSLSLSEEPLLVVVESVLVNSI